MTMVEERVQLGGREVVFETGAIARQASGAVFVREGDTVLMAVVSSERKPTRLSYMPLIVEYRHKLAAAGRIPGGYERREGKATTLQILVSRLVDRSVRPFFPDSWRYDTQVIIHPLSYDGGSDIPTLAITAASVALNLSDVAWSVPLAAVRVVRHAGELVAFPSAAERADQDLDLVISLSRDGVVMLEGGGDEVSEAVVLEALQLATEAAAPVQAMIERLREKAGKPKRPAPAVDRDEAHVARVEELAEGPLREALGVAGKLERYAAVDAALQDLYAALELADDDGEGRDAARDAFDGLKKKLIRAGIVAGERLGGRGPAEIRAISGRAGWLPRTHGSSLFTRGETQAIVTCTLGTERDAQRIESLDGDVQHGFLLHYNFPPYCVGEVRPLRGPGRREIGHGLLARRALLPMLPAGEEWPYTTRLESTITESNGSSSMATVCGGTLALLDAGVPMPRPVAGIAMGLVQEGEDVVVLSDILGDEDHVGDMDFKVGGTREGITAIQLDNKLGSLPLPVMEQALSQARAGLTHILDEMAKILAAPRESLGKHAPRVAVVQIQPNRIRDLIGSGGSTINGIREDTGVEIDVDDDGTVRVFGPSEEAVEAAKVRIHDLTGLPSLGETYEGRVVSVKDFGSFVRIFAGIEGLLFGEQLNMGAKVAVKVTGVNPKGKLEIQRA